MSLYKVRCSSFVTFDVDAESEDDAIEKAQEKIAENILYKMFSYTTTKINNNKIGENDK